MDVENATNALIRCLNDSVDFMQNSFVVRRKFVPKSPWFDKECFVAKKKLSKLLHRRIRSRKDEDKLKYATFRREYKELLTRKKNEYRSDFISMLQNSLRDSSRFGGGIRRLNFGKRQQSSITVSE